MARAAAAAAVADLPPRLLACSSAAFLPLLTPPRPSVGVAGAARRSTVRGRQPLRWRARRPAAPASGARLTATAAVPGDGASPFPPGADGSAAGAKGSGDTEAAAAAAAASEDAKAIDAESDDEDWDAEVESLPLAAAQVDDGSASGVSLLPRPLVFTGDSPERRLSFARTTSQLRRGFDSGVGATAALLGLFMLWYGSNTAFNVYNKRVLGVFPFPITCTLVQCTVAAVAMSSLWLLRIKKTPVFNKRLLKMTAPLAGLHAAGFLLTNMSLGKVSVAFTHTVKATEPFFSVALTPSILGDIPTWGILMSLVPIVAGVGLASFTEASFNWAGFLSAVGSNVAFQSRNVLSKKLTRDDGPGTRDDRLDNINLFAIITILALVVLAPLAVGVEGLVLSTAAATPAVTKLAAGVLPRWLVVGGLCRCADVLASYMILQRVSPVTHSVGNCVKRAIVIVSSIVFFRTRMQPLNVAGTVLALFGVLCYSIIVSACKQNTFGKESGLCKPVYGEVLEDGAGI
ncbi:hypothetical protein I4F81_011429 [Pyropia yezoensis]|uniref:Uncharacterized protein n=1 Tax=Pyropia yezoensis TaxID=2788 RepID=A0ACC3CGQ4_PYRYE|nr:hypothetical protein I4F81_011429 [Neopyropia yezoensis]